MFVVGVDGFMGWTPADCGVFAVGHAQTDPRTGVGLVTGSALHHAVSTRRICITIRGGFAVT